MSQLIDDILKRYERESETIEVVLPFGEKLKFRQFEDADDFEAYLESSKAFVKLVESKEGIHPNWKPYLPKLRTTALKVHLVSYLSIEPKLAELDAMKLAKGNESVFTHIYNEIESQRQRLKYKRVEDEIEEGKDGSEQTHSVEPCSTAPKDSTDATSMTSSPNNSPV